MSHFTKLDKAKITSVEAFVAAAAELGLRTSLNATAKCFSGRNKIDNCDAVVHVLEGDDIALVKNSEGKYDMQADWSYRGTQLAQAAKFKTASDFQDRLIQLTTKHTIINKYRRQGFRATVTEDDKMNLNIKLQKAD